MILTIKPMPIFHFTNLDILKFIDKNYIVGKRISDICKRMYSTILANQSKQAHIEGRRLIGAD